MAYQITPTASSATKAREALVAVGVRANVARQRYATRVVVLGERTDALIALAALRTAGFTGAANGDMFINSAVGNRHCLFAYEVRA